MKSFQPLLLAAIAVCTSAHAGNSGKQTIASVPDNAAMPIAPKIRPYMSATTRYREALHWALRKPLPSRRRHQLSAMVPK